MRDAGFNTHLNLFINKFGLYKKSSIFALTISRGGAVAARWAHNPKVVGSNPASATHLSENPL